MYLDWMIFFKWPSAPSLIVKDDYMNNACICLWQKTLKLLCESTQWYDGGSRIEIMKGSVQ
jgi:hypothetical protein